MRISVIIPILLTVVAFICSLLVLIAGRDTDFLTHIYLLRLDTSQIKPSGLDVDIGDLASRFGFDLPDNFENFNLPDSLVDTFAQTTAKKLGLRDFYTSHVMNYCEGFITDKGDNDPLTNDTVTTYCSPVDGLYAFNPVDIFETELLPGITPSDIGIPSQVEDGARTLAVAYKVMFITYAIGVAIAGLSLLLAITIGWRESRGLALALAIIATLGLLCLIVASGIATAIAIKLRNILNDWLIDSVNVRASNDGGYFLGMTWAAVAAMFFVVVYWSWGCCCARGSRSRRGSGSEKQHMMREV